MHFPLVFWLPAACLQGVGVGLFRGRGCAVEACNKLSGAQADGRKLELVLMNSDNHISFSCRQVRDCLALMGSCAFGCLGPSQHQSCPAVI